MVSWLSLLARRHCELPRAAFRLLNVVDFLFGAKPVIEMSAVAAPSLSHME
jgi:hypothetical protein